MITQHKLYDINTKGTDYVVGDIHGCFNQLELQMKLVGFDKTKDRLFSVGDLIDRGPDSAKVLELIQSTWFHPVIGNHEYFMIDCLLHDGDVDLWYRNGGSWLENENLEMMRWVARYLEANLPLAITVKTVYGNVGICHAQPPSNDWGDLTRTRLSLLQREDMIWSRSLINRSASNYVCKNIDITIHGHTPIKECMYVGNALFIDTGSFLNEFGYPEYPGVKILNLHNLMKPLDDRV